MASCGKVERHIQAHLDNELTAAERVVFEHHLSECAACARRVARAKATSALLFEAFAEVRLRESLRPKVMAHLPEMEHLAETHPSWQPQYKRVRFQLLRTLAPALAPVLVLLLGITLFYSWPASEPAQDDVLGMVTQRTGLVLKHGADETDRQRVAVSGPVRTGERYETDADAALIVVLAGPTVLKADANTRFKVESDRKVVLEAGRIWLDVAKDPRLFRVETPSGGVTVFGTTFDVLVEDAVSLAEPRMTVTVAAGEVHVESGVGFAQLRPGQQVEVVRGQRTLEPRKVDPAEVMAWAAKLRPAADIDSRFVATAASDEDDTWGDTMFLVPVEGRQIRSIILSWLPDMYRTDHSGYHVYVYDSRSNPLCMDYIAGRVLDNDDDNSYVMLGDRAQMLEEVGFLKIRLVPDRSGLHATTFKEPLVSN